MSESNTDDKKEEEGAQSTQTSDSSDEFVIKIEDGQIDDATRELIKRTYKQNKELMASNKEMTKIITEMNTERQLAKRDVEISKKLEVLREIRPELAEKHKNEKEIAKLDLLISVAKEYDEDFPELRKKAGEEEKEREIIHGYVDPATGKIK
jgi:hypothetical protein